jgi:hypothetical protein
MEKHFSLIKLFYSNPKYYNNYFQLSINCDSENIKNSNDSNHYCVFNNLSISNKFN